MYPSTTRTSAVSLTLDIQYITMVYDQLLHNTPSVSVALLSPEILTENLLFLLPYYLNQDMEYITNSIENLLFITCDLLAKRGIHVDPQSIDRDFDNVVSTVLSRVAYLLVLNDSTTVRDIAGRDLIKFKYVNSRLVNALYE